MDKFLEQFDVRQLRLLFAGVGAIIVSLVVVSFVVPSVKAYRTAANTQSMLQVATSANSSLEPELAEHEGNIRRLKSQLLGDLADLPEKQVESFIIGKLQRIAWRNDIELVSVEPSDGERVQIFDETLFKVKLSGQYVDLYRWLIETREELGFVVVKEYRLQRHGQVDENPTLMAELNLASYRAEK